MLAWERMARLESQPSWVRLPLPIGGTWWGTQGPRLPPAGNSLRAWATSYDPRDRERRAENGQQAWASLMQSGGAAWGGAEAEEEEEEAADEGGGGGGGGMQLALTPAKRGRNPRLEAMLAAKAAKVAALEARKLKRLAPVSPQPSAAKRERGRPSGWSLRDDAPEFLSAEEFALLSTKDLQELWGDYYTGGGVEAGSKSGNRAYLRRKLVMHGDESSTLTSAGGQAAATTE